MKALATPLHRTPNYRRPFSSINTNAFCSRFNGIRHIIPHIRKITRNYRGKIDSDARELLSLLRERSNFCYCFIFLHQYYLRLSDYFISHRNIIFPQSLIIQHLFFICYYLFTCESMIITSSVYQKYERKNKQLKH